MLREFYADHFLKYIQSLQDQFSELSTKRLYEQNHELKIKL